MALVVALAAGACSKWETPAPDPLQEQEAACLAATRQLEKLVPSLRELGDLADTAAQVLDELKRAQELKEILWADSLWDWLTGKVKTAALGEAGRRLLNYAVGKLYAKVAIPFALVRTAARIPREFSQLVDDLDVASSECRGEGAERALRRMTKAGMGLATLLDALLAVDERYVHGRLRVEGFPDLKGPHRELEGLLGDTMVALGTPAWRVTKLCGSPLAVPPPEVGEAEWLAFECMAGKKSAQLQRGCRFSREFTPSFVKYCGGRITRPDTDELCCPPLR